MSRPRVIMRKIREVLRLTLGEGLSIRDVTAATGVPLTTVREYLKRARNAGITWPLPEEMDDSVLEALLFPPPPPTGVERPMPDWREVHKEMRRPHVSLMLLWDEYRAIHPDGYGYSQFCQHYHDFRDALAPTARFRHRAGEAAFVDFCGDTIPIWGRSGEIEMHAEVFVAVLGCSSLIYAEVLPSQKLYHVVGATGRAFHAWGGAPRTLVPDNLKAAVLKADRYEPIPNATFAEFLAHYGSVALPTRPYKPRDKAKVEASVLVVERWILARLRKRRFGSIPEANEAVVLLLEELNSRPSRSLGSSRREIFEATERAELRPLPAIPYDFATWRRAKVSIDYHVALSSDRHHYSVPYRLIGERVELRISEGAVEIHHRGVRVAVHPRSSIPGSFTTDPTHMPASHRAHTEWSPSRIVAWAERTGPRTAELASVILSSRPHPEQGYRSCLGLIRLGRTYPPERLEAACARALFLHSHSYRTVASILKSGLDSKPLERAKPTPGPDHDNLRGPSYYH